MNELVPTPNRNVHADKVHRTPSGFLVHGVSHSWAQAVDQALADVLDSSPNLRHVAIQVPKADRDVTRLFHSDDGVSWRQVQVSDLTMSVPGTGHQFCPDQFPPQQRRLNTYAIVRGAQELDGDPAFPSRLTLMSLRLREQAGHIVRVRESWKSHDGRTMQYDSIVHWVEATARLLRDAAGEEYLSGAGSEEALQGRRQSLVTIERLIDHLRLQLRKGEPFTADLNDGSHDFALETALRQHFIRQRYPFLSSPHLSNLRGATQAYRKKAIRAFWADAAGLPHDTRFDRIYGTLLRSAEGHPVYGDRDYRRLEALLGEALREGYHVVRLGDRLFQHSEGRWRSMRADLGVQGQPTWSEGWIISRNHGRLIVPPHWRDGELVPGYTRNGPGEGPSTRRSAPLRTRCVERPIGGTDLAWLHAYHAWEIGCA